MRETKRTGNQSDPALPGLLLNGDMMRAWLHIILLLVLGSCWAWQSPPARAQNQERFDPTVVEQILDSIEIQFTITSMHDLDWLDGVIRQANRQRTAILLCIEDQEKALTAKEEAVGIDLIDQVSNKEGRTPQEEALAREVESLRQTITECKLLLNKANQLLVQLTELETQFKHRRLNLKEQPILFNLMQGALNMGPYLGERWLGIVKVFRESALIQHGTAVLMLLAGGVLFGLMTRRFIRTQLSNGTAVYTSRAATGFRFLKLNSATIITPIVLVLGYLWIVQGFSWFRTTPGQILWLIIGYLLVLALIPMVVQRLNEHTKSTLNLALPARKLDVRLALIATLLGFWLLEVLILDADTTYSATQHLVGNVLTALLLLSCLELAFFLHQVPTIPRIGQLFRVMSIGVLLLSLLLDWIGYQMLSRFLWQGLLFTAFALVGYYLFEHLLRQLFNGIDHGKANWQVRFRRFLSIADDEPVPGLIWLRLSSIIILWGVLILFLLEVWGVSDSTMAALFSATRDGFRFGDTRIVPLNVLIGVFIFAALLMLARWVRDNLNHRYLSQSKMDSGAKEALVTIIGYVGFIIAALIGFSVAGVSFSNLAIIAGALSLGIGFGLQNIVNNFVSGIILLFERPIRTGDWIVTGSTEGFVKKISVRSTEVQTFDRADVIVPNSDLISAPVTNWTLRDRHGRITIPVGVAYGSDTELVERLLEEAALEVPEIVPDDPQLPIRVFFLSFGDSALLFQLRCYVHDLWNIMNATSKLHFIIDRKFREHGITIAFPQREIHILNNQQSQNKAD